MLTVNITENDEKWIVKLQGEVDIYTVDKFKKSVSDKMEIAKKDLVIEMDNLEYIDSTGLGALINIRGEYENIDIQLLNLRSNVKKLFDITGLSKIFKVD